MIIAIKWFFNNLQYTTHNFCKAPMNELTVNFFSLKNPRNQIYSDESSENAGTREEYFITMKLNNSLPPTAKQPNLPYGVSDYSY